MDVTRPNPGEAMLWTVCVCVSVWVGQCVFVCISVFVFVSLCVFRQHTTDDRSSTTWNTSHWTIQWQHTWSASKLSMTKNTICSQHLQQHLTTLGWSCARPEGLANRPVSQLVSQPAGQSASQLAQQSQLSTASESCAIWSSPNPAQLSLLLPSLPIHCRRSGRLP